MATLHCHDLQPGDIMLKLYDKSLVANVVYWAQTLFGAKQASVVHAGLMFDQNFIIEAQGPGVTANHMAVQNKDIPYSVYRCRRPDMAQGAGTCAKMMFDIHQRRQNVTHELQTPWKKYSWKTGGPMKYAPLGAAGSLFNRGGG